MLFDGLRSIRLAYLMYYWPFLSRLRNLIVDKGLIQRRADYYNVRAEVWSTHNDSLLMSR